jgi:hypothetical protein
MNLKNKPYHHFFDGYTFEQEKKFKEIRKILFEENEYCEIICKVYCESMVVIIGICLIFCL